MEPFMSSITHILKTDSLYWDALESGSKKAEFRKADRDFQTFDGLCLVNNDTREELHFVITHVLRGPGYGIPEGYCMLSIEELDQQNGNSRPDEEVSK